MNTWIEILQEQCKKTSQAAVARKLDVSTAMVNQVLKGTYKGSLQRIESLVRGTFMQEQVTCPVLGLISTRRCLDEQVRPFAPTNPQRVQLFKACRGCSNKGGGKSHGTHDHD